MQYTPSTIILILTVVALVISPLVYRQRKLRKGITDPNTSVLLTYYLSDLQNIIGSGEKEVNGLKYTAFAAQNIEAASIIYCVQLPFATKLHLLGVPKRDAVVQLNPDTGGSLMERVDLEGDYQNYFTLFAEKKQQVEARYTLDPAAMAFTVDFCRSHNWEIINKELYFLQSGANEPSDPTDMFKDITTFIEQIRPAISRA